ncbi:FAD-binding oxidoreductase [Actinomarinicola tropica]|uniref:FAD-binding protein n=1 Tax=Actinomarinicola tropica TaxID=2789776 RepID=A0A5Q2RII2_9ACTN|nr:FAD-binding oxidoreductase [Actinomarinicola tropica]QGG95344.1 FAD-binding protein [Actinomarinicola tropica]
MADDLLAALAEVVGATHVLTDEGTTLPFRTDWTGRWTGECRAVVRPGSTAEAAAVVRACAAAGVPVVPQGGNTGLVAGSVPAVGSVVVSTRRLDAVGEVDDSTGQITAGAGATLAAVQAAAAAAGWRYAVDLAARDTATVGGTIATNAGGHHVVRHGMTRRHVVGVEAVLPDGSVISHLGGLVKDNTGYDLAGLLCGSEGTLGVITAARLALVPAVEQRAVALVGFTGTAAAVAAIGPLRRRLPALEALELVFADGVAAVGEARGARPPFDGAAALLLVEVAGSGDLLEGLAPVLADLDGVVDTAVATDGPRCEELWRWRDDHTDVINQVGDTPPHKLDVTVPLDRLGRFVEEVRALVADLAPAARLWLFGHAGDGNLHVNVTGLAPDDETVDRAVVELVAGSGGSISAEHGIGRAKRPWLHLNRTPEEIAAFRSIKDALDPAGILNPGVLVPERR